MKDIESVELQNKEYQEGVVLIDVWAPWCGPCRMLAPQLDKLSSEITDVKFVKINSDENEEYGKAQGIRSIPTVIILKDGAEVSRFTGVKPMQEITELLNKFRD